MTMTFKVKGNLASDPQFSTFGPDTSVRVRLHLASDRFVTGPAGERTTVPDFHDITLFGDNAEQFREASKGDPVTISGDVRPNQYNKDGVDIYGQNFIGKKASWQNLQATRAAKQAAPSMATSPAADVEYHSQEHFNAAQGR